MFCKICSQQNFDTIIDLGTQTLGSVFPSSKTETIPQEELCLVKCRNCSLVQLTKALPQSDMYETNGYGYRTGINETMVAHIQEIVKEAETKYNLTAKDNVLDIGSNDGTLLHSYTMPINKYAIDPTGQQFKEHYATDIKLTCDYFSSRHFDVKFKVITSIAMFYDLPNPIEFMQNIKAVLHSNGVWITEQSYLPSMLENNSFDTICHEHLEYYTLTNIHTMAEKCDLKIVDVSFNDCNGGSFRVALTHKDSDILCPISIRQILTSEAKYKTMAPYVLFKARCEEQKDKLMYLLHAIKAKGKSIYLYGASTKGNTLLQYYGITNELIDGAAERNPNKYGRYTPGTHIPILSEKEVRARHPDYMLVLPWHFKEGIIEREATYLRNGGRLLFPLPQLEEVRR